MSVTRGYSQQKRNDLIQMFPLDLLVHLYPPE
jgi:hypothetical protein